MKRLEEEGGDDTERKMLFFPQEAEIFFSLQPTFTCPNWSLHLRLQSGTVSFLLRLSVPEETSSSASCQVLVILAAALTTPPSPTVFACRLAPHLQI